MAIDAVDRALMTALQTDAVLTTLAPGGVHREFVPESLAFGRCVVVTLQSEESVYQHGGPAHWRARFQIKVVDPATTKTAAQAALDRIDALLNSQPLTITGQTHMNTDRVDRFDHIERDGALIWQHVGCDYEVWSSTL